MLLKKLLVFFAFVGSSCTSFEAREAAQEVDDILAERNYTFKFTYEGCFGGGTETLEIRGKKIAIYTFPVYSAADRIREKVDTLPWTREKEVLLRTLFRTGIQISDTLGDCTNTTNYTLAGSSKFVAFTDRACALSDILERLIK
jgi:hypothetical protein